MSENPMGAQASNEPTDRLTFLCDEMTKPLEREENSDVKAVVFLHDAERGGIVSHGYGGDEVEPLVDLFIHLQAMFASMGKQLDFIGVPNSPEGIDDRG